MPLDYHLDRKVTLKATPEHSPLYGWAISEVDEKGKAGPDQIPWPWAFDFTARSCEVLAGTEIRTVDYVDKPIATPTVKESRSIYAKLRPGLSDDLFDRTNRTRFSMFGTGRMIEDFQLRILPASANDPESCTAWGCPSYTTDTDFRDETTPDVIVFTMLVKPETFARYAALIAQGAVSGLTMRVHSVSGFYSDWSPSISTTRVKVLAHSSDQAVESLSEGIDPPRLGGIGEATVIFARRLTFEAKSVAADDGEEEIAEGLLAGTQAEGSAVTDPKLLKAIRGLKRAVWLVVVLLVAILLNLLSR